MANKITLQTFAGKNMMTGETIEHDLDEIKCNGMRIGFVPHAEGSGVRFLRILSEPTRKEIIAEVAKLRQEQGKAAISEKSSMPPDPEKLREAMAILQSERGEDMEEDDE